MRRGRRERGMWAVWAAIRTSYIIYRAQCKMKSQRLLFKNYEKKVLEISR